MRPTPGMYRVTRLGLHLMWRVEQWHEGLCGWDIGRGWKPVPVYSGLGGRQDAEFLTRDDALDHKNSCERVDARYIARKTRRWVVE